MSSYATNLGCPLPCNEAKLVAGSWHVKKDGKKVSLEFLMQGKSETLAFNLGMLTSLSVYGTRKYMLNAKKSEANETVGRITKDLATYVNHEELSSTVLRSKAAAKPQLLSLPPVPARFENVRAKVYQSTKGDWAAWSPIKFTWESAQRYQYRVQAAKDGMSAEVIAEGDLDGNGIKSRFSLAGHVGSHSLGHASQRARRSVRLSHLPHAQGQRLLPHR